MNSIPGDVTAPFGEKELASAFWREKNWNILASVQRARQLRKEVKEARQLLPSRMDALKKELAAIRKKRQQKSPPDIDAP
jgi:hypothetical protein